MNIKLKLKLSTVMLLLWCACYAQTPAYITIEKLPQTEWSNQVKGAKLSDTEKLELLKMLPKGERVEFVQKEGESSEETEYISISLHGLDFFDLDFDGDLDLLYTGLTNRGMGQYSTKVYYNEGGILTYYSTLRNGLLDINKRKNSYQVYTQFHPCCDSYTTRIDQYNFSEKDKAVFVETISLIGRSYYPYKGMPDFSTEKSVKLDNTPIYAIGSDRMHGWFKERNKEVKKKYKEDGFIELTIAEGKHEAGVLNEAEYEGIKYLLVITEPLNNQPRCPTSIYERSEGDGRRLIGWVRVEDVK